MIGFCCMLLLMGLCTGCSVDVCENAYRNISIPKLVYHRRIAVYTPVLISLPFSGSVAVRELIEYSTGYFSGSFGAAHLTGYSMKELVAQKEIFYRQGNCSLDCSVVSVDEGERSGVTDLGTFSFLNKADRNNCRKGGIYNFARAIWIVRNPYIAILREFEDAYAPSSFHPSTDNDIEGSHFYQGSIDFTNNEVMKAWSKFALDRAQHHRSMWDDKITAFADIILHLMIFVKYEDLEDSNLAYEIAVGLSEFSLHKPMDVSGNETLPPRLKCALGLLQHKYHDELHLERYIGNPFADKSLVMTIRHMLEPILIAFAYNLLPPSITTLLSMTNTTMNASSASTSASCASYSIPQTLASRSGSLLPPLLLSVAGSGAYFLLDMLEILTGQKSGRFQTRERLPHVPFTGFTSCKMQASMLYSDSARSFSFGKLGTVQLNRAIDQLGCYSQGSTSIRASNIVVVTRNPYESLVVGYLNYRTYLEKERNRQFGEHNNEIKSAAAMVNISEWEEFALNQAKYMANDWLKLFLEMLQHVAPEKIILLDYSQLMDPRTSLPLVKQLLSMYGKNVNVPSIQQLECIQQRSKSRSHYLLNISYFVEGPFPRGSALTSQLVKILMQYSQLFGYTLEPPEQLSSSTTSSSTSSSSLLRTDTNMSAPPIPAYADPHIDEGSRISRRINCAMRFGTRHFCSEIHKKSTPPMLLSFPGAGNTWIRLLMEYGSGFYTGSIYNRDVILDRDFLGERQCSQSVSAIKVHPQDALWRERKGRHVVVFKERSQRIKCDAGLAKDFRRVLYVARNPYNCILSEYHRTVMSMTRGNSHQLAVTLDRFNRTLWRQHAIQLSKEYDLIWNEFLLPLLRSDDFSVKTIKYEDMINASARYSILNESIAFISQDLDGSCLGKHFVTRVSQESVDAKTARLNCAFLLADTRRTHRSATAESNAIPVTSSIVYKQDPELVQQMWIYLQNYSNYFGYSYHL